MVSRPPREYHPPIGTPTPRSTSPKTPSSMPSNVRPMSAVGAMARLPPPPETSNLKAARASNASGRWTTSSACHAPARPISCSSNRYSPPPVCVADSGVSPKSASRYDSRTLTSVAFVIGSSKRSRTDTSILFGPTCPGMIRSVISVLSSDSWKVRLWSPAAAPLRDATCRAGSSAVRNPTDRMTRTARTHSTATSRLSQ